MPSFSRLIFTALIALCWSGLAAASPDDDSRSLDASTLRAITNIQLDAAFESFVSEGRAHVLHGLAGPSTMSCSVAVTPDGIETCLVTTENPTTTVPAALAQR